MEQVREIISKGSTLDQLMSEVKVLTKVLTKEDRHSLLDMVSMREAVIEIPPDFSHEGRPLDHLEQTQNLEEVNKTKSVP